MGIFEWVPCRICGDRTMMSETKLCNGCYQMERNLESLKTEAAERWLLAMLAEVRCGLISKNKEGER